MRKLLSFPFKLMAYFFGVLFGVSLLLMAITKHGTEKGLGKVERLSETLSDALK